MTKPLHLCTPEQAARQRASVKAYKLKNQDRIRARQAVYDAHKYKTDPATRARKDKKANECRMLKRYGMTREQAVDMWEAQRRRCACCGTFLGRHGWHIDHCHRSDKVRGILCVSCNVFIGKIEKSAKRLEQALAYIERHQCPTVSTLTSERLEPSDDLWKAKPSSDLSLAP
jgi:Recombination endonuclease VII